MWTKWLPWRYVISQLARRHGFLDPLALMSRLQRFSQPSEVSEPIELLRAGVVFHARGLINSRAIQHNLDWVWPFWVERQFNPRDVAFIPRAFSITHVNLTHRNWTAVGQPDCDWLPIVDPRGLVTPLFDGWSLDAWIVPEEGPPLLPSKCRDAVQQLKYAHENLEVETQTGNEGARLKTVVDLVWEDNQPCCRLRVHGEGERNGWLVVSLRPANPEGVSFIHRAQFDDTKAGFLVDDHATVQFSEAPRRVGFSDYRHGDVLRRVLAVAHHDHDGSQQPRKIVCDVGLVTTAAMFRLEADDQAPAGPLVKDVTVRVPLTRDARAEPTTFMHSFAPHEEPTQWQPLLNEACRLKTADQRIDRLFQLAICSLILHSPGEVYPGPYTYKRFWFRDAAFILHGLLVLGFADRVRRSLELFPKRQSATGYFHSQEGEWDSNGEAIWILHRWSELTDQPLSDPLMRSVMRGARWIRHKRLSDSLDAPHAGLMPAGFSAEHLGPNDFYYWDDFWSVAGLRSAAALLGESGRAGRAASRSRDAAERLMKAIDRSLERRAPELQHPGIPASPYRRMDAGAIGSLAAAYPLQLWEPHDPRMLATVEYLLSDCMVHGGFFQDMIHSGINPYLTLHIAQVLLRAGDTRFHQLLDTVAQLASPTGQWPEAVHPHTKGGCMGDGQHIWAAAEWVLAVRNALVLEESDRLVLAAGVPDRWLPDDEPLEFGPTLTRFGPIRVSLCRQPSGQVELTWDATWHRAPPEIEIRLAGFDSLRTSGAQNSASLSPVGRTPQEAARGETKGQEPAPSGARAHLDPG